MYKILLLGKRMNNKTFKTYDEARIWADEKADDSCFNSYGGTDDSTSNICPSTDSNISSSQ